MKQPILPMEGDRLFENVIPHSFNFFIITMCILLSSSAIIGVLDFIQKPSIGDGLLTMITLIGAGFFIYLTFEFIKDIFKNGYFNEDLKGYYFSDKIIFYRISNQVDKIYTQGLSKEQINAKIEQLKVSIDSDIDSIDANTDNVFKRFEITRLEKGLDLIENGLRKPHKFEVYFSEIKYFINENNQIKLVEKTDDNENVQIKFYNNLSLSKKYKKHQPIIVEFLNQRVKESIVSEIEES